MQKRGSFINPVQRFESYHVDYDDINDSGFTTHKTQLLTDDSQSIITFNKSPDLSYDASLNPYRGCEHGCSYCYARPYHEFLGFNSGLDFETKIVVKPNAATLLRKELARVSWKPTPLALSGVTDCYQPVEKKLRITRGCLEVLAECRQPVGLITKNALITRDADVIEQLARHSAVAVYITLTTLDRELAAKLEPRASSPRQRLEAVKELSGRGIPVTVLVAPVIPGLNDHEIPLLLEAAKEAGATAANYSMLRLPHGVKAVFTAWLQKHLPERADKILGRVRDMRGGELNESAFGQRLRGSGIWAEQVRQLFRVSRERQKLAARGPELSIEHFRRPLGEQMELL